MRSVLPQKNLPEGCNLDSSPCLPCSPGFLQHSLASPQWVGRESLIFQPTGHFCPQPSLKDKAIGFSGKAGGAMVSPGSPTMSSSRAESPVCQEDQAPSGTLKEVWSQLRSISSYFQTQDQVDRQELGWLALLERFDRLLFQSYLVVLGLYAITLCSLWVSWSG